MHAFGRPRNFCSSAGCMGTVLVWCRTIILSCFIIFMQMSTKEAIAQNLFTFDALYKRQVLLDQLKEGLKLIGALKLIQTFPNEMLSLFTFQGQLAADDVIEAIDVKVSDDSEGLKPEDEVLVTLLRRYIRSLTHSCRHFYIIIIFCCLLLRYLI